MIQRFQPLFWRLGIIFAGFALACSQRSRSDNSGELITILLQEQKPGLQSACEIFVRTENLCVINASNVSLLCNGTLQTRLRNKIQPEDKRTDPILEAYFRCFDSCNREFNVLSRCADLPFSTNDAYRTEQRTAATLETTSQRKTASLQWIGCYEGCRSVNEKLPPENSPLRESGTTFPEDWFEVK